MTLSVYSSLTYSPIWYSANALDTLDWNHDDKSGIFYFGARNSIFFMKVTENLDDSKIINDQTNKNYFYDAKLCFFVKAHHELIVGVFTLPNEILINFKNERKLAKIISCGKDKMIRVWSFEEDLGCNVLKELNIASTKLVTNVTCISVSQRNIAVCGFEKGFLLSWNYVTDKEWKTFATESEDIVNLAWNSDKLAIGYKRGLVSVYIMQKYDTLSKLTRFKAHHSDTCNISWNPYNDSSDTWGDLATIGKDCRVSLFQIDTNFNVKSLKLPNLSRASNKDTVSSWSSLCWSNIDKGTLIVSTSFGNLGIWKSPKDTELKYFPQNSQMKTHTKTVFGISEWRNYPGLMVSHSLDRSINISKITENGISEGCVYSLLGLGGFVMSLSGVAHTNQLAVGCGDNNIRLWKYDAAKRRSYDVTNIWNGVEGRVMSVSWHPFREGLLAFGTEDGQVGFVNVNRDKKLATSSQMQHKGKVFVVTWGIDLRRQDAVLERTSEEDKLIVYSVGNYALFGHDFRNEDYFDASTFVSDGVLGISDFCVDSSLRFVAVGYGNGVVNVYEMGPVALVCVIKSHSKGINCMRWGPLAGNATKLAIGSNERYLTVTDLTTVFKDYERKVNNSWIPLEVNETVAQFKGHGDRITCVDWSPFDEDKLVSGSYDYTAFVWSVVNNGPLVSFNGHQGKLFCCHWSCRDSDLIYTGGDDSNLFAWRLSEQSLQSKLNKRRQVKNIPGICPVTSKSASEEGIESESKSDVSELTVVKEGGDEKTSDSLDDKLSQEVVGKTSGNKGYIKKRMSLFPTTLFSVHYSLEDYHQSMIKYINGALDYLPCFAMFSSRAAIITTINKELEHHSEEGNLNNYFTILVWTGRIGRVLRECVTRNFSPDWLMTIIFGFASSSVPADVVQTMVGNMIVDRKDPVLAATCLLATGQSTKAVELLISNDLAREALILAKLRLAPDHPLIHSKILPQLQATYFKNGNYELAAMCSLTLGNYTGFIDIMGRRNTLLANWVVIKTMIHVGQNEIVDQHVGMFIGGLLLQMTGLDVDARPEACDWLARVASEDSLTHYSVLRDLHVALWIEKSDLGTVVSVIRSARERFGGDRIQALQNQVRARLAARQATQVTSQICVHVTYEVFVVVVGGVSEGEEEGRTLESLGECLRVLKALDGYEGVWERLVASGATGDMVVNRLREQLSLMEV